MDFMLNVTTTRLGVRVMLPFKQKIKTCSVIPSSFTCRCMSLHCCICSVFLLFFSFKISQQLFSEALQSGTMEGFFKLISYFQTQSEPAYCGLASLSVVLNALAIDPGRKWKGNSLIFKLFLIYFPSFFFCAIDNC